MTRMLKILLIVLGASLCAPCFDSPAQAAEDEEDLDQSTKDRKLKEKEQKKKDKKFNDDRVYRFMVGPDTLPIGPFLYVRGQLVEGRLRIAIQAQNRQAKTTLEGEKWAINGIVYPLALRMWENGRPSTEDVLNFKTDTKTLLQRRYSEQVKDVFIES
ncbi:MAG: hypothetical protein P8N43_15615 [Alphaproteobacteria bacterium]|nr:hypothetical protein [Alphaproteobacteria bacterium]